MMPTPLLALGLCLAFAGCSSATQTDPGGTTASPSATESHTEGVDTGIFADIHGWIVYGDRTGIWAVNPSRPEDQKPKHVIDLPGEPLGWSSDGTKLLIKRESDDDEPGHARYALLVMDADGTKKRVAGGEGSRGLRVDGSISPDGTQVIYSDFFSGNDGIHIVETDGGTPRLLLAPEPEVEEGIVYDRETSFPVFSPNGTEIAYFDGHGDWGHRLRVMNTDGTDSRTLYEEDLGHIYGLAWSPDGQRLVFSNGDGTWIIGIDGSRPIKVARGNFPAWSPDGSQIAYADYYGYHSSFTGPLVGMLCIAQSDGTQEACFTNARPSAPGKPWNPLPLAESGAQ